MPGTQLKHDHFMGAPVAVANPTIVLMPIAARYSGFVIRHLMDSFMHVPFFVPELGISEMAPLGFGDTA